MIEMPEPCLRGLDQVHLSLYGGAYDHDPALRAKAKEYLFPCHYYQFPQPCPRAGWTPEPQGPRGAQPQDGRLLQHKTTRRVAIKR